MEIINTDKAARILAGDVELFKELMNIIENSLDEKYSRLETALAEGNGDDLELYAHQFKGALRNIAAEECCAALEKLEKCGATRDFPQARGLFDEVRPLVQRLFDFYRENTWEKDFLTYRQSTQNRQGS
ncbi:MAG: Hpt domain-containing protein [Spirochaetales bacterium]|nr:Hpt domain-containing protein [Spirochaetales bacterium]